MMNTLQQDINLSEINVQLNNSVKRNCTSEDSEENTENVASRMVDSTATETNLKQPFSEDSVESRKYLYKANYNNSNNFIIKTENQSERGVSIIKTKENSNSSVSDCSKESLWKCGKCVSTTVTEHSTKCVAVLACIAVVLFIVIIILISLLRKSSDEKQVPVRAVCDYSPCLNNATCSESDDEFICQCADGFSGNVCENTPCSELHCLHGGTCVIKGPTGVCKCVQGFSGTICEVTPCSNVTCQNGGRCDVIDSDFHCACSIGAKGIYCEETPCRGITCMNGGTCIFIGYVSTCACPHHYYGKACEKYCEHGSQFYSCSFEDDDPCFLINTAGDNFNWTRNTGSTPSHNTGPTAATEGSKYMYMEASSPAQEGYVARLISDQTFSTCARCLYFSYHMFGMAVGKLNVYHGATVVWTRMGNIGEEWLEAFIDISGGVNKSIIFEAVRGSGVTGDIAIDDIWFSPGSC